MPGEGRHLATVLFLDIVGSTRTAEELGDERWRLLLGRFLRLVRGELKRNGGREVDTAGDGFFATFSDPKSAVRAATSITSGVQAIGLDVRVGIHAGEVERAGKKVAGLAVHIGARVMSLAGPGQVYVTSTVRDLERGGDVSFRDAGEHQLKGVEGSWHLYTVRSVSGHGLPVPLQEEQARARRAAVFDGPPTRRKSVMVVSAVLVASLAATLVALARSGPTETAPPMPMRTVLVKVDVAARSIAASIDGPAIGSRAQAEPGSLGGRLVRVLSDRAELRDMKTGDLVDSVHLPIGWEAISIGGQAIWLATRAGFATEHWLRFDRRTGRRTADVEVAEGVFDTLRWGPGGGWFITGMLSLGNLDPASLELRTFPTPASFPISVPYGVGVWVADAANGDLFWFDGRTEGVRQVEFPRRNVLIVEGPDVYTPKRLFLLDPSTSRIEPLGKGRIDLGRAFTITGELPAALADPPSPVVFASRLDQKSWVLTPGALIGLPIDRGDMSVPVVIEMPSDFRGNAMLADPADRSIWVLSCDCDPLG